jgi:hypothetical protein
MSQRLDRKLSVRERVVLNLHLFVCKWCLDYARQLSFLRDTVRTEAKRLEEEPADNSGLPMAAKERMKRSLTSR